MENKFIEIDGDYVSVSHIVYFRYSEEKEEEFDNKTGMITQNRQRESLLVVTPIREFTCTGTDATEIYDMLTKDFT